MRFHQIVNQSKIICLCSCPDILLPAVRTPLPACRTAEQAVEEPQCDCLFCGTPGPDSSLTCSACHRSQPFCAASGKRMALNDWSACPACRFPCRGRDMTRAASVERCCPLCEAPVAVHDVKKIFDPVSHLRRTVFAAVLKELPAAAAQP